MEDGLVERVWTDEFTYQLQPPAAALLSEKNINASEPMQNDQRTFQTL
jgi:hypothetical protein